jgi:hypothetical protein
LKAAREQGIEVAPDGSRHRLIEWGPASGSRDWDMGHRPNAKYSILRDDYLSGRMSTEQFLDEYRDPANHVVEDPLRNRSHDDE